MSSKRKHNSIKELKERYGLMFISPWIVGMILLTSELFFSDFVKFFNEQKKTNFSFEDYNKFIQNLLF